MSLALYKKGTNLTVSELLCKGACRQRLIDQGIMRGTKITVNGFAPLGDPMLIKVNGFDLAIRKSDAKNILVM